MTSPPRSIHDDRPLSAQQLAERWDCSKSMIYKLVKQNRLRAFWIGELMRFSAAEVERYESCPQPMTTHSQSSGSGEDSPSSGGNAEQTESAPAAAARSPRKIARAPRRKPAPSGKPQTIVHGPWAGS
ncbi:MAG: helix-turn-helix domain-containing protein [Sphingobium sp.]|nr:helix-turn-helix domain-containing protein [Sphingobium sp.]MBP6112924.1 helix-turn-helix domain-containing protein [Sphingobium sp.]MBP8670223.1 helix-turn-helix domain-containing protein [Sphingobium sp.]MBP9157257.1 helix-turn-helix domain-containing protein [Sphingobium sp.]